MNLLFSVFILFVIFTFCVFILIISAHIGALGNKIFGDKRYEASNGWFIIGILISLICLFILHAVLL